MDKKKATAHFKKAILLSYLSPLGTAREERPHGLSGGVGGVLRSGTKRRIRKKILIAGERENKKREHRWWSLFLLSSPNNFEPLFLLICFFIFSLFFSVFLYRYFSYFLNPKGKYKRQNHISHLKKNKHCKNNALALKNWRKNA